MGKVGSSTVVASLQALDLECEVHHVHFLSHEGVARATRLIRDAGGSVPHHLHTSHHLRARLDAGETGWRVVSLFREPIARAVSNLFQNAALFHPEVVGPEGGIRPDAAVELLVNKLASFDEANDYVCTWFDRELGAVFGADLFAQPFDHEAGYTRLNSPAAEVVVLRLEDFNRCFQPAMRELIPGGPDVPVVKANVRAEAEGEARTYRRVKQAITVPRPVAERIYASQYVRHLYPKAMIEQFMQRWCGA